MQNSPARFAIAVCACGKHTASRFCRAMLCIKRGLSSRDVCPSVTFVYSVETNNRLPHFFHRRIDTPFSFFHTKRYGNCGLFRRGPLTWATRSSAVAKRPRDASCLPVVSFNSTLRQAQYSTVSNNILALELPLRKLHSLPFGVFTGAWLFVP